MVKAIAKTGAYVLEARIHTDWRGLLRLYPQNADIESIDDEENFYFGVDSTLSAFESSVNL